MGKHNLFLSPQSQFRILKEALAQSQFRNLLKKCCSATATPQFRNRNFILSPHLQVRDSAAIFWHIFGRGIWYIHERKIGGQKSRATVPLRQVFGFQRNRQFLNIYG